MSRTPAAGLARVKVKYPQWSVRRVTGGEGYTAWRPGTGEHAWAPTLAALEARLRARRSATAGSSPQ
jgi:hypothetical protein